MNDKLICAIALFSRICVIFLQFIFNALISDHKSDGFISPAVNIPRNVLDDYVFWILGGFLRWDAQHFLHIAIYGYVYEATLAFFPGFPLCIRVVGFILQLIFHNFLNILSIYLISSVIVNLIAFILAARSLFHLTFKIFRNRKLAVLTTTLFVINPASIFFTAPYSEALFSFFTFQVMLNDNYWISCIFVALSSAVRSNGIINLGFPLYREFKKFFNRSINCRSFIKFVFKILFMIFVSSSLFIVYQIYSYKSFCTLYSYDFDENIREFARRNSLVIRGQNISKMCRSWIPYFYVQNHYWNVGFLNYFRFRQLPNFALALPIIVFSIEHCIRYFRENFSLVFTLGMLSSSKKNTTVNMFPYYVHLTSLVIICLFFIHIQVTTRLLCSSSPAVYWFGAALLKNAKNIKRYRIPFLFPLHLVYFYSVSYMIIGTALFSNFYPWT